MNTNILREWGKKKQKKKELSKFQTIPKNQQKENSFQLLFLLLFFFSKFSLSFSAGMQSVFEIL